MKLLLDAHVLLWALYEPEKLTVSVTNVIADEDNELFVSLATVWELINKAAAHRLPLAGSSVQRLIERIEELGVMFLRISQEDIIVASTLHITIPTLSTGCSSHKHRHTVGNWSRKTKRLLSMMSRFCGGRVLLALAASTALAQTAPPPSPTSPLHSNISKPT